MSDPGQSIDFSHDLNPAQWEAVRWLNSPLLVIAGAGSGKTRTIIYRLAYLAAQGADPQSILLLTFTRKAAQEMLSRAAHLSGPSQHSLIHVTGGTFHSFAYSVLRRFSFSQDAPDVTIMDRTDAESLIKEIKNTLELGRSDRSYPKSSTIIEIISKARNKEIPISEIMERESFHLLPYLDDFQHIDQSYAELKRKHYLFDYDDLLFATEKLFNEREDVLRLYQARHRHIMVDEYQDTNRVQARLVRLLAGPAESLMAVGDDAQSIYAFRGADVRNILEFPNDFPGTKIIKLEENYRSLQPILTLTNQILGASKRQFHKELVSVRSANHKGQDRRPDLIRPLSDLSQARLVVERIIELLSEYPAEEIAVLFRAGYQSYHVEMQLAKMGLKFQKFGGLKFSESAHAKDVLAYLRLVHNPGDITAFNRVAALIPGIGPKTAGKLLNAILNADGKTLATWRKRKPEFNALLLILEELRGLDLSPAALLERIIEFYRPTLEALYPDDHPRRLAGLEELVQIASSYRDPKQFLADLSLELPTVEDFRQDGLITLSTIHSAKGLEWSAVLIIDLVDERFPSRHAKNNEDDYEEERRLLYVACTRAKDYLGLFAPAGLYRRHLQAVEPVAASPFLPPDGLAEYIELPDGRVVSKEKLAGNTKSLFGAGRPVEAREAPVSPPPAQMGFCRHKIFGRGKIVQVIPPNRYRVNFPGIGLKVIISDYVELE